MKTPIKYSRMTEKKAIQVICNDVGIDYAYFMSEVQKPGRLERKVIEARTWSVYFLTQCFGYTNIDATLFLNLTNGVVSRDIERAQQLLRIPGANYRWRDIIYIIKKYNPLAIPERKNV